VLNSTVVNIIQNELSAYGERTCFIVTVVLSLSIRSSLLKSSTAIQLLLMLITGAGLYSRYIL